MHADAQMDTIGRYWEKPGSSANTPCFFERYIFIKHGAAKKNFLLRPKNLFQRI